MFSEQSTDRDGRQRWAGRVFQNVGPEEQKSRETVGMAVSRLGLLVRFDGQDTVQSLHNVNVHSIHEYQTANRRETHEPRREMRVR